MSEAFSLERGVRQGSPLLGSFVVAIEFLAQQTRCPVLIKGIKIGHDCSLEVKLAQYAEYTTDSNFKGQ